MTKRDTLFRIGMAVMGFVALYLGFLWWLWLVGRMGAEHAQSVGLKLVLAAVVFLPILLFLWLMARLISPAK